MDDLKLLNALPGRVDPPDQAAKDRMRAMMEARTAPIRVRRRRRAKTVSLLGIAAVVTVATLAATIAARPWTAGEPVGLPSGSPDDNINDPTGRISTPGELASAVAEFAPAIRLPDGGSFDPWRLHLAAHPEWGTRVTLQRADLAESMVIVAECQWGQRWLDSSERGDHEVADQAMGIFATEGDWLLSAGAGDAWTGLVRDMRNGERLNIELFESGNCAYSGAWGSTPAERDAKAKERLTPAITTVPAYLRDGGDPQAFRPSTATDLTPGILWTVSNMQPAPASPGSVFIASSSEVQEVTLVSVSEAGAQFCAVVTTNDVVRGTTTHDLFIVPDGDGAKAAVPEPVPCDPGGW